MDLARVSVLEDTAKELMDEQGGSVKCYGLDIRGPQDVDNTINEIFEEGPIHGLVNNAGAVLRNLIEENDADF